MMRSKSGKRRDPGDRAPEGRAVEVVEGLVAPDAVVVRGGRRPEAMSDLSCILLTSRRRYGLAFV